ncbi:L,D-transpeptidase [Candidatus Coxiella mudrowiae]|uniref:L,D-transpeptidase n=1 Tax=Candidatus Coxiella mudrowiae TaxID=2054173 RepID=UPI0012FE8197|nr:L,D-transpeptidase [Candidatus Coxiella mudrowiae]
MIVNLGLQAYSAYDKDVYLVHWGFVSGGKDWYSDIGRVCNTPTGTFQIFRKGGADCISIQYLIETEREGAPMPYCMPYCMFYFRGYSLHGLYLARFSREPWLHSPFFEGCRMVE